MTYEKKKPMNRRRKGDILGQLSGVVLILLRMDPQLETILGGVKLVAGVSLEDFHPSTYLHMAAHNLSEGGGEGGGGGGCIQPQTKHLFSSTHDKGCRITG